MENKKEELSSQEIVFLIIILLFLGFLVSFLMIRAGEGLVNYDNYCVVRFGENWTYEFFNDFGNYCVELDYNTLEFNGKVRIAKSNEEMNKIVKEFCNVSSFLELNKWEHDCE